MNATSMVVKMRSKGDFDIPATLLQKCISKHKDLSNLEKKKKSTNLKSRS